MTRLVRAKVRGRRLQLAYENGDPVDYDTLADIVDLVADRNPDVDDGEIELHAWRMFERRQLDAMG